MCDSMKDVIDFADIINQINRREMKRVYEFNLMLVGTTGVGKSTLVRSLFQNTIKPEETVGEATFNEYSDLLKENGVQLKLRCIETCNFTPHKSQVYSNYIDEKFKAFFVAQCRQPSWDIKDTRVHCCLYLIQPHGKLRLQEEDIQCMRSLHERVNLIPIITKADSIDESELLKLKENLLADLKKNGIKYYKFTYNDKEDEDRYKAVKMESERFPFAVVAAKEATIVDGKARWICKTMGAHSDIRDKRYDFDALAKLLIRHCMLDLIDSTHVNHYAKFKARMLGSKKLEELGLDQHEICRIEYNSNLSVKGDSRRKSLKQQKADLEEELKKLRNTLQTLRSSGTPAREKPAILRNKPDFLRNLRS